MKTEEVVRGLRAIADRLEAEGKALASLDPGTIDAFHICGDGRKMIATYAWQGIRDGACSEQVLKWNADPALPS